MRYAMTLKAKSNFNWLLRCAGKRLPTSRFNQATPIYKFGCWMKLPALGNGSGLENMAVVRAAGGLEKFLMGLIMQSLGSYSFLTNALVRQQKTKLTTYNHWCAFLWGQGAIYRGRETDQRRLVGAIMRGAGFGSPKEGAWTVIATAATVIGLTFLKNWWVTCKDKPAPELAAPDVPPAPRKPGGSMPGLHVEARRRKTLRDLVIYGLMSMGMSEAGANKLVDGEMIYGADADVYRRICSLIFIRCTVCDNMTAIEHADLMHAVLYFDEDDMVVSYCLECQSLCEADVTAIDNGHVVHLHS
jgi:hypothetical protein